MNMRNIYDLCEHEYEWSNVLKKKKKKNQRPWQWEFNKGKKLQFKMIEEENVEKKKLYMKNILWPWGLLFSRWYYF